MAFALSGVLVATCFLAPGGFTGEERVSLDIQVKAPIFQKADKDLLEELKANGIAAKPEKNNYWNGKAHFKPDAKPELLTPLNMTGKGNKGIAILVDFQEDDGVSKVPGVELQGVKRVPREYFDALLNGEVYNPYTHENFSWITDGMKNPPLTQTMKNYYKEVSYDQYGIEVEVVDWVTLPKGYNYYMGQDGYAVSNENGDAMIGQLVADAIAKADANGVDFSQYAVDAQENEFWFQQDKDLYNKVPKSNGTYYIDENGQKITKVVPNIFIIHRGTGAEFSSDPSIIWSHKWDIMSALYWGHYNKTGKELTEEQYVNNLKYVVADGAVINTYNIVPEVGQDISGHLKNVYKDLFGPGTANPDYNGRKPSPAYVGVYAHEFGHVLGLPDQYDYGYDSEGTGMFTLMAGGSYGRNVTTADGIEQKNLRWFTGNSPVHMDAWSKYYLGFAKPTLVTENKKLTLRAASQYPDIYRIDVPGSNGREYFLLENRQLDGFDKGFLVNEAIKGLVVYHVVDDIFVSSFHRPNEAANPTPNHRTNKYLDGESGQTHYAISVIQADGNYDLEKGNNDGDAGDTFPGAANVINLLSAGSKINTNSVKMWNSGSERTGINLVNIKEVNGVITLDVVFK